MSRDRRSYPLLAEDAWERPRRNGYRWACCDCALVHRMDFRTADDGAVEFRAARDNRATGQLRRQDRRRAGRA